MDGQTAKDVAPAVVVVGRHFTVCRAVNFTITTTGGLLCLNGYYEVKDTNGDVVFKAKGFRCFRDRWLLLDAAGTPLLTMKQKAYTWHARWRVFRGESTSPNDLLFSVRKPKICQWKDNFDVILATANTDQATPCDFKITGRCKSCTICIGESDEIIAQMHPKNAFFARDKLEVTVTPNVDYVFILSLIIVLREIRASCR
ncbi:protein LURP-one-related 15-like [Zingiber officinale]|uniref:Protein LURP-one-related 15 n=1 Tax=Zingiber officinale TaxID=94328 RepID=A0A8J5BZU0_ZINOF|nr:protein LURP-one-related 15-like [Zingiber officinale]KAG6469790.1 hypothetical protein ZIOFF_070721 [Zingiber officinale]